MRLVVIGRTNAQDPLLTVPDGDILICTGDFSSWVGTQHDLERFNIFLGRLPHKHKLVIFGDREEWCECHEAEAAARLFNAYYLCEETVEIGGLKIYGAPWTPPQLGRDNGTRKAFCAPDDYLQLRWNLIPNNLDVLVTHCPPHLGGLYAVVKNRQPKLHVYSHGNGNSYPGAKTKFVSVDAYDLEEKRAGQAVVINL
jgi:hypothetical protein